MSAFRYLAAAFFVLVVVQVALAGFGAFDAVSSAESSGSVTKDSIDSAWSSHAVLGSVLVLVALVLVLIAAIGKLGAPWLQLAGGLFVASILQIAFGELGRNAPALGFLHTVNALAIFAGSGLLAHRAWARRSA